MYLIIKNTTAFRDLDSSQYWPTLLKIESYLFSLRKGVCPEISELFLYEVKNITSCKMTLK